MAKKTVGIIAVHGMGSFGPDKPESVAKPSYSDRLYAKVRGSLGANLFDADVAWGEVFYADILEKNQSDYLKRVGNRVSSGQFREFVVNNLGDPASYSVNPYSEKNTVYGPVRERISKAFARIEGLVQPDAPIIVLAHSLGGHVMSNHIWDSQHPASSLNAGVAFPMTDRIAAFVTFGCNIPIFTFALAFKDIETIKRPSNALPNAKRPKVWWRNYYDFDDVLGFPLAQTGKGYDTLAKAGELADFPINAGSFFTSWNPFSHTGYWADDDLAKPVADLIRTLL
jgi:hypothetical protein